MIHHGDCIEVMAAMPEASVDAIVTDPPYGLEFMGRSWDRVDGEPVDPAFLHWFAGFVDGEGCFSIHKKPQNTYDCQFSITLRADDRPILERIQRTLGMGTLSSATAHRKNQAARWTVSSKAACVRLRDLFRAFPLRAKKAKDFELWSDALNAWVDHRSGEWDTMSSARELLMASRAYRPEGVRVDPFQMWSWRWGREALRVTKPGGYLLAFGGTRTHHRLVCGLEDAGWIIRDELDWIYASGFPKGKANLKPAHEPIVLARKPGPLQPLAIDECRIPTDDGYESAWDKPISSNVGNVVMGTLSGTTERKTVDISANKPVGGRWPSNVLLSDPELFDEPNPYVVGSGAVTTVPGTYKRNVRPDRFDDSSYSLSVPEYVNAYGDSGGYSRFFAIPQRYNGTCVQCGRAISADETSYRLSRSADTAHTDAPTSPVGTSDSTVSESPVLWPSGSGSTTPATETASSNDAAVSTPSTPRSKRRATSPASERQSDPARSQDVASLATGTTTTTPSRSMCATCAEATTSPTISDSEGLPPSYPLAFIVPKADRSEREPRVHVQEQEVASGDVRRGRPRVPEGESRQGQVHQDGTAPLLPLTSGITDHITVGVTTPTRESSFLPDAAGKARVNSHPTVKPTDLMRHLIRLVTPIGGTVLDPFLGSGSTALAAEQEGFAWIGIEKEAEYVRIAEARLNGVQRGLGLDVPAPTTPRKISADKGGGTHCSFFPEPCQGHPGHGRYGPTIHARPEEAA